MYKAIIEDKLLSGDSELSGGLITGLKDLADNGFQIVSRDFDGKAYDIMDMVFRLEGINLAEDDPGKYDKVFIIATRQVDEPGKYSVHINPDSQTYNFRQAVNKVLSMLREHEVERVTKETKIKVYVSLDGRGDAEISTGIGFFDHMLEQIAHHGNILLKVKAEGDLKVDEHHTVEDVGIAIGEALLKALGKKQGIRRFGFFLPMDDANAQCAVDLSGRTYLDFQAVFLRERVGEFPTELTEEFFRGLANGLRANITIKAEGKNDHHKIEAIFKSFARALNDACSKDDRNRGSIPSTKGSI